MQPVNATIFANLGIWIGFFLSLFLFSFLIRDNLLARLAQHLLAGALIGYVALISLHDVLRPRLLEPLLAGDFAPVWIPALLAVVLLTAGIHRTFSQPSRRKPALWQRALFNTGRVPVAILVGTALGIGIVGAFEGTLLPQYLRAAQIALEPTAPAGRLIIGLITVVLTTGVMLYLYLDPTRYADPQPGYVRRTLRAWMWIGRHALWLAAGIIFARLLAARMSLLIAQFQQLAFTATEGPLARWLESLFSLGP